MRTIRKYPCCVSIFSISISISLCLLSSVYSFSSNISVNLFRLIKLNISANAIEDAGVEKLSLTLRTNITLTGRVGGYEGNHEEREKERE